MQHAVQRTGYQGFGSFMVETSVEQMVLDAASDTYLPPSRPFPLEPPTSGGQPLSQTTPLGEACRDLFMTDFKTWTFLNHGAFGGVCVPAHQEAARWREYCEKQPLKFLDRELFPQVVRVMRELARSINAQPQDLVLLPNATTGLNVAIQSAGLAPGGCLYMLDIGYGSVKKMAAAACGGAEVVYGHVTFPLSDSSQIVDLVSSTLPAHCTLAVFDAVTSNTAVVLPIRELVELCRTRGVPVLIDAAHALGQLPVDVQQLDADYYVANCHKWLAAPRGSAMMWVHPRARSGGRSVPPLVVSHGSGSGFVSDFIWDGCRDYAPYLVPELRDTIPYAPLAHRTGCKNFTTTLAQGVSAALDMWARLGEQRCRDYMQGLLHDAVGLLASAWGTDTLVPLSLCASMALVRLPTTLAAQQPATSADAKYIQDLLHFEYHIECPVKCIEGQLYVRISAFIYTCMADYQTLASAIQTIQAILRQNPGAESASQQAGGHP